ncbi:MAG: M56 family metallopeptidase [Lentimicrobiaceae bacterium]|nr:M56 family metallopeptidase [Lentimicrobiaceae bacterium]
MTPFLLYLIKVAVLNAIFVGFYSFSIKPGRNFRLMRAILLAAIFIPLLIPLLSAPPIFNADNPAPLYVIQMNQDTVTTTTASPTVFSSPNLYLLIYTTITGLLALGMLLSLFSILNRLRKSRSRQTIYGKIYLDDKALGPFSFFRWVFFSPVSVNHPSFDLLLRHEFSHVAHMHSIDRLISNLFRVFIWFSPFAHINHRLLSEVHEYQADADAITSLTDIGLYHKLLRSFNGFQEHHHLANQFSSHLKKRIIMLNNLKDSKISLARLLSGIVLVTAAVLFAAMVQPGEKLKDQVFSQSIQNPLNAQATSFNLTPQNDGEVLPVFPGGEEARIQFFRENLRYPNQARQNNIKGNVDYTITIDENGKVTHPEIQKGLGYGCDEEVLRVLSIMPDWKPGSRNGKPAAFKLPFTVAFGFSDDASKGATMDQNDDNAIYTVVEMVPSFTGGDKARIEYLQKAIIYPEQAQKDKVEGTVYVSFVVEKDGNISDVKVLRGIGSGCDEVAIKAVSEMPPWEPGRSRGKPVRVQFNMPLKFTLQVEKDKETK